MKQNTLKNKMPVVRSFIYTNKKGETSIRTVLVMNEDTMLGKFEGFEMSYLSDKQQKACYKLLKEHKTSSHLSKMVQKGKIDGLNTKWFKAWRQFDIEKAVEVYTKQEFAKAAVTSGNATTLHSAYETLRTCLKRSENNPNCRCYGLKVKDVGSGFITVD